MADKRKPISDLIASLLVKADEMDRREAIGWVVICVDQEYKSIVATYGLFSSPEEALVEAGKQAKSSLPVEAGDAGWRHDVKPVFPPVFAKGTG